MKQILFFIALILMISCNSTTSSQPSQGSTAEVSITYPTVKVRLNNASFSAGKTLVDVEFQADNQVVTGMNVRFWFNASNFNRTVKFTSFAPGYTPYSPTASTGISPTFVLPKSSVNWFNFSGDAIYVNGAINLADRTKGVVLTNSTWTKLFQIELIGNALCPAVVLDLEANPANGSFLNGSDGVVISVIPAPGLAGYAMEQVQHLNWQYQGSGTIPYGSPVPCK